jgi:hypothetical protein
MFRRKFIGLGATLAGLGALPNTWAQAWPARPIRVVATFPPGGFADTIGNRGWNEASYTGYPSINVVAAASVGFDPASGVLSITGSEGDDAVEVRQQDKNLVVSLISASGQLSPTMGSATLSQIAFSAAVGNDTFTNLTVMPVRRRR